MNVSSTAFQEPSAYFLKIVRYLPFSVLGAFVWDRIPSSNKHPGCKPSSPLLATSTLAAANVKAKFGSLINGLYCHTNVFLSGVERSRRNQYRCVICIVGEEFLQILRRRIFDPGCLCVLQRRHIGVVCIRPSSRRATRQESRERSPRNHQPYSACCLKCASYFHSQNLEVTLSLASVLCSNTLAVPASFASEPVALTK